MAWLNLVGLAIYALAAIIGAVVMLVLLKAQDRRIAKRKDKSGGSR